MSKKSFTGLCTKVLPSLVLAQFRYGCDILSTAGYIEVMQLRVIKLCQIQNLHREDTDPNIFEAIARRQNEHI